MGIKIVKENNKKPKRKKQPYYVLTYNYMIGDSNGYTTEECRVSPDNPFLENFVKALKKLKPLKGHWGVSLSVDDLDAHLKQRHITKAQHGLLLKIMTEDINNDNEPLNKDGEAFVLELSDGIRSETEYSFLTFEDVDLIYFDEYGKKSKTKIK